MRAIAVSEFGGPDALHEVELPEPEPGPGEVRIRVQTAGVNPGDLDFRAGAHARLLGDRQPPFVPGMDIAGVVDRLGPDTDGRLAEGDEVIALANPVDPRGGSYAEKVVVPAASAVAAPRNTRLPAAATLLLNGLTARLSLDALGLAPGQTVAVTGAAGILGGYALQLAKADGLRAVGDAAPGDELLIESLGADAVVRRGDDISDAIRRAVPEGVPGLIDGSVQQAQVVPAIADGGGLVETRPWDGPTVRGITVHKVHGLHAATETERLQLLTRQADEGVLQLRVAEVLPASQAARAHQLQEARGIRGRLVLDFTA
jgi:NADPH:quinone reductase-like Zn-dependent oxidoreductase